MGDLAKTHRGTPPWHATIIAASATLVSSATASRRLTRVAR
jgi:hypothetical protein